jgi:anti-sigma regulatory factor (Ser/Thr protein kinase)
MQRYEPVRRTAPVPLAAARDGEASELEDLRTATPRQAHAIDALTHAVQALRRGAPALKAANADLRTENTALRNHRGARVGAGAVERAQLLVSELVSNSVRHSGASPAEAIVIRFELAHAALRVEVEDPGEAADVTRRAPDRTNGGGFGLHLVHTLSERWGAEPTAHGGTRVWAQLGCAAHGRRKTGMTRAPSCRRPFQAPRPAPTRSPRRKERP